MKWKLILLVLLLVGLSTTAVAKVETLTYEELLSLKDPQTVSVLAKTGEPTKMSGSYFTTATTWPLFIKNSIGEFIQTDLFIDMDQYDKMSLGERCNVLNHKEFTLTVTIDENKQWTAQYGKQAGEGNRDYYIIIIILILCFIMLFVPNRVKTTDGYEWRPGKGFAVLSFLGMLSNDRNRKRK